MTEHNYIVPKQPATKNYHVNIPMVVVQRTREELLQTLKDLSKQHTKRMRALMGDDKTHLQVT